MTADTDLRRASSEFLTLTAISRRNQRNNRAPVALASLQASADRLLTAVAASLPTPTPNPHHPTDADQAATLLLAENDQTIQALQATTDAINAASHLLANQLSGPTTDLDPTRATEIISQLQELIEELLRLSRKATSSPDPDLPSPVETTPQDHLRAVTASMLSGAIADPTRFDHTPLSQAALHQVTFTRALIDRAHAEIAALPTTIHTDGRGFPLQ